MNGTGLILGIISTTLMILLLILGIVLVFFISSKQRLKQEFELAQTKLSFAQELRQVETEVSEQLMEQFAMEIHDNAGHLLTAMHFEIENQKLDHPELSAQFKLLGMYLEEVTNHLRLLSRTLNRDYIKQNSLLEMIELEVELLRRSKRFLVQFQNASGKPNLDKDQELLMLRIIQEIFQNVLRHSAAKQVAILVENENNQFSVKITDDGKGFDLPAILQSPKASGLRNILKRAQFASMDCSIETAPGKGTVFYLRKLSTFETKK